VVIALRRWLKLLPGQVGYLNLTGPACGGKSLIGQVKKTRDVWQV